MHQEVLLLSIKYSMRALLIFFQLQGGCLTILDFKDFQLFLLTSIETAFWNLVECGLIFSDLLMRCLRGHGGLTRQDWRGGATPASMGQTSLLLG